MMSSVNISGGGPSGHSRRPESPSLVDRLNHWVQLLSCYSGLVALALMAAMLSMQSNLHADSQNAAMSLQGVMTQSQQVGVSIASVQTSLQTYLNSMTPPAGMLPEEIRLMEDLKLFSIGWTGGSYDPIRNVVPAQVTFTDSITGGLTTLNFGTLTYSLVGKLNPSPYPSGGNVSTTPSILQPAGGTLTSLYTIMLIDPDSPDIVSHERVTMHWWIVNVPATSGPGTPLNINAGTAIYGYLKPGPLVNTGLHRYTIVVFKQNEFAPLGAFPPTLAGTDVNGHSLTTTVSNGRYYGFPTHLFAGFYPSRPVLVALNYMQVFNYDRNQPNFPVDQIMGVVVYTVGGAATDLQVTRLGSGYISVNMPTITITGCAGASVTFNASIAISATGTLNLPIPSAPAPGLQTTAVSILGLLNVPYSLGTNCAAGASVAFNNPPTVASNS